MGFNKKIATWLLGEVYFLELDWVTGIYIYYLLLSYIKFRSSYWDINQTQIAAVTYEKEDERPAKSVLAGTSLMETYQHTVVPRARLIMLWVPLIDWSKTGVPSSSSAWPSCMKKGLLTNEPQEIIRNP